MGRAGNVVDKLTGVIRIGSEAIDDPEAEVKKAAGGG